MNSALVTGVGPVRLTGPTTLSCSSACRIPPTSSSSEIHGMYWVPGPSRPPRKNLNSGLSTPSSPPAGASTSPVRRLHHPAPRVDGLLGGGLPVAAHLGEEPGARRRALVGDAVAGVAVVADRRRRQEGRARRARRPRRRAPRWARCGCRGSAACGPRSTAGRRCRRRRARPPRPRRRTCPRRCARPAGPSRARRGRPGCAGPGAGRRVPPPGGRPRGRYRSDRMIRR